MPGLACKQHVPNRRVLSAECALLDNIHGEICDTASIVKSSLSGGWEPIFSVMMSGDETSKRITMPIVFKSASGVETVGFTPRAILVEF